MKYKFLLNDLKSQSGSLAAWKVGEWRKAEGELELCKNGFHCSPTPRQALSFVHGSIVAEVEVRGAERRDASKSCHREMRIVRAWHWRKEDSVAMAIFAAELVLPIFEKKHPKDERPRKAIEAVKAWLADPSEENRTASYAAAAAAYDAADAAYADAAYYAAADAAAYYADTAYADAAYYAAAAADAAYYAANYAANAAEKITAQIDEWMLARLETLEVVK